MLPASPGATGITVTVQAQSPQGLPLTYAWVASAGWTITAGASGATVTITAPATYGASGTATVTVTDSNAQVATGTVVLYTVNNQAPIISNISVGPQPITDIATLLAAAIDPLGGLLTSSSYAWSIGGISNLATGNDTQYVSTGMIGIQRVKVTVTSASGLSSSATSLADFSSGSPWPSQRRDLGANGASPVNVPTNGTVVSGFPVTVSTSDLSSSISIGADGTLYFGSKDFNIYAMRADGSIKWSYATTARVPSCPAVALDGTVYAGSDDHKVYALHPDGTLVSGWPFTSNFLVYAGPVLQADGSIVIPNSVNNMHSLHPDGTVKWVINTSGFGANGYSGCPSIAPDGTIYVGSGVASKVTAVNPKGTSKWVRATGGAVPTAPAIARDGTIYVGCMDNSVYALNPDGTVKWTYATSGPVESSPALLPDGTIIIGSDDKSVYALNPTGTLKWSYATGGKVFSSPAIGGDGVIYIGSLDGKLYALRPDGTLKWSYTTGSANDHAPTASIGADGTVYVPAANKIYAFH